MLVRDRAAFRCASPRVGIKRLTIDGLIVSIRSAGKMLRMIRQLKISGRASSYSVDEWNALAVITSPTSANFVVEEPA
jgi:hypothetical protein